MNMDKINLAKKQGHDIVFLLKVQHLFTTAFVMILFAYGSMTVSYAQVVESVSGEVLKDVSFDEVYWVVSVRCQNVDEPRVMQQLSGDNKWCAVELPNMCAQDKTALSNQMCSERYDVLIAEVIESSSNEASNTPAEQAKTPTRQAEDPTRQAEAPVAKFISEEVSNVDQVSTTETTAREARAMALKEIEIEEELIQIEEEMLALRVKELELELQQDAQE